MATAVSNQAEQHVSAGARYLALERPDDAAAEFMLAIRESGSVPNADALRGLAFAYVKNDAKPATILTAFEDAHPHNLNNWSFWFNYALYLFEFVISLETNSSPTAARMRKDIEKHAKKMRKRGAAELERGVALFSQQLGQGDIKNAIEGASCLVEMADWLDAQELNVTSHGYSWDEVPFRDLAPPLYRVVADSNLETVPLPDGDPDEVADLRQRLHDEVVGRARRQLVFRGQDGVPKSKSTRGDSTGTRFPVWAWVIAGIVWLILLLEVPFLAIVLALGGGGFFVYRKAKAG